MPRRLIKPHDATLEERVAARKRLLEEQLSITEPGLDREQLIKKLEQFETAARWLNPVIPNTNG